MIHSLHIEGYRSLLDFSLKLAPLTVIQGTNGAGKSNLYKALRLFGSLATGSFPAAMAAEGGTESCFWAGPKFGPPKPKTVSLNLKATSFTWKITFGLIPSGPGDLTMFKGDPDLKKESLVAGQTSYSRSQWAGTIPQNESLISYHRNPALSEARDEILSWRFYDNFRHDPSSPLRNPAPCAWSPILSETGGNLAAAIQTILETNQGETLSEIIELAFPNHTLSVRYASGGLELQWHQPSLSRPTSANELSDGTLQFITLCAALLSPKPPFFLVLNEPENSLNPTLFPALVELIRHASGSSQVLVITHSETLSELLQNQLDASHHILAQQDGATRLLEDLGPRKVWRFDD